MFSHLFLGLSLVGAEWVLYILITLSVVSVGLIIERFWYYHKASRGLTDFRQKARLAAQSGRWNDLKTYAEERTAHHEGVFTDLEAAMALSIAQHRLDGSSKNTEKVLEELAQDAMLRAKVAWEQRLVFLATIGTNAPFVGLFGTVLGIIKAFHSLSEQAGSGVPTVTAGIAEALVATAIGILVAIPAVVAFNIFQRRIRTALSEAEALKSFLVGKVLS